VMAIKTPLDNPRGSRCLVDILNQILSDKTKDVGELVVNKEIVKSGYAWVYRKYCDQEFCTDWAELERIARDSKMGLWQDKKPVPPWEWRKRK
jgi:endonuclease YncB( thermonuclease family)